MIKRRFPIVPVLLGELFAWVLILCPMFCSIARAQQDISVVGGTNPYIILGRGLQWGGSGTGNLNNNFIFSPVDPNQGFCLFLSNNNPTSAHSVSVSTSQTGDPALHSFQGFSQKWFGVPTVTTFPTSVPASGIVGINYKTTASAGITVSFSGATTQAGSPDTVDVFAVQTNQSACGSLSTNVVQGPFNQGTTATSAQQFPVLIGGFSIPGSTSSVQGFVVGGQGNGFLLDSRLGSQLIGGGFKTNSQFAAAQGVSGAGQQEEIVLGVIPLSNFGVKGYASGLVKTSILDSATDQGNLAAGSMPAWIEEQKVTNPGTGAFIVGDALTTTAAVNEAWKTAVVSCSVACEFQIANISSLGTTCTAVTAHSMQLWPNAVLSFATGHSAIGGSTACAAQPTIAGAPLFDIALAAGTSYTVDLTGLVNFHQAVAVAGLGIFNVTAFTGTMQASISLVEE